MTKRKKNKTKQNKTKQRKIKDLWLPCSAATPGRSYSTCLWNVSWVQTFHIFTITRVWKGIRGIHDLTKIQCRIRETLTGYGIWLIPGIRDSPIYGHRFRIRVIRKKNYIRDSDDRSSGCGFLVRKERECKRDQDPPFQDLYYGLIAKAGLAGFARIASTLRLRDNPANPVTWNRGLVIEMA